MSEAKLLTREELREIEFTLDATRNLGVPIVGDLAKEARLLSHIAALEAQLAERDALVREAVKPVLIACANSYINAWTQDWLERAARLGAYRGPVIGTRIDVLEEWNEKLDREPGHDDPDEA